ncbi:LIM domain and actin-binding protein 1 isoform X3 [Drosophila subpulchrella]|uniref:LIM domain and actin-binding protein 1 isoform X3 n=1 Tax=Drosophila subpulchrella TaxID=1486046 RepID=UPI0018A1B2C2|nr:LIM domain and actin-binding protein 1 isoform X3 [Drosophila subpulchrella]
MLNKIAKFTNKFSRRNNKMDQRDDKKDTVTLSSNISKGPSGNGLPTKKGKSKRSKTNEYDTQNINMKKSFTKFDDLQKRNVIHVRSRDSKKAQEIFRSTIAEQLDNCRQCKKPVYKMEEVILQLKTGTTIFHKTCLRCKECGKQLKSDSYNVHDGSLYCSVHFKLIFAPKIVYEEFTPLKPELIIRENQPIELPPDVARASDKPSLGLDELQQLNVRSKFKVFENGCKEQINNLPERQDTALTHSKSIRSTLTKLHKLGITNLELVELDDIDNSDIDKINTDDENDIDFLCSRKDIKRERPVGLGEAMNDIRSKFEQGELMTKEERREERKQEIQSIRSRLFLGKQAKIKEMYQLAVAESEQGVTSVGKTPDINVIKATHLIKDRFENGEVFNDNKVQSKEAIFGMQADADVFESGIGKASRSIFMELDANISSNLSNSRAQNSRPDKKIVSCNQLWQENTGVDVIKCDSKPEEVKVATEELTERFKFFEKYAPLENKKKTFRMTPPRDGVVKMPSPDSDSEGSIQTPLFNDNVLQKTKTTSTILSKFREMEVQQMKDKNKERSPKPLKCFTPPPEIGNHFNRSDTEEENDSDSEQNTDDEEKRFAPPNFCNNDQGLYEAQNAARAKQLRAKFEKWQINEIERELNEGRVDTESSKLISNESIESAKKIRERFENMNNSDTQLENAPRSQVKRFVVCVPN